MCLLERAISSEERIRRAEEIYYKRRMQNGVRVPTSHVNTKGKAEYTLFKKMILQILICLLIYFIFYLVKNSNYIFSESVINKTREFLSHDINLQVIYSKVEEFYNNNIAGFLKEEDKQEENANEQENMNTQEDTNVQANEANLNEETINVQTVNEQAEGGIGGGEEGSALLSNEIAEASADEEPKKEEIPLTQMEIDANEIKANYSFILPLKGTVSSRFGPRTPTEIVSANHAGIDIAANEGTVYVAAMEGIVTYVSGEGGYGNHVYIEKGDVTTIYAHCKTIYVKEGEKIVQGQKIGEVGATGNATGPHLHFEVRKENRVVNPEYILTF